ncbi:NAD(P)-dependent oxidoreductase [Pedobacter gandavensis]|uniref:NAD-dependent epimerase/dehydratase family protein n=1 Tax=Pedobacter gandavensis TaxID=2679963 RepID=UPI002478A309|nr:NAD(P)-dependent oxidoreductase [Pedobacter gandavensis]WGQ09951.1 NAD(P)-dependent oxidoreductase [Pedobacter gandavensis]
MKVKKRILLTGASGTVGFEVLKQLVLQADKYEITAIDQKTKNAVKLLSPYEKQVNVVYGDLTNAEEVAEVCVEKDFLIHLAAIIPPLADEQPGLAYDVNVNGTRYLIQALKQYSPDAFMMYSSSISVYGDRLNTPWIKTSDPLSPSLEDHYAVTKIESEQHIRNSGLDFCIFRLAAIMGTGNHKPSGIMFHMPLATSMEILTPEDTARAFVNGLAKRSELSGKTFNLGGGALCRISYQDFLTRSFEAFGLGALDFPSNAFAEKNFHCGYYADGDELEELLHFRRDTLEHYFTKLKQSVSPLKKTMASVFRGSIKRHLLKKSEPFHALLHKDKKMSARFFNKL